MILKAVEDIYRCLLHLSVFICCFQCRLASFFMRFSCVPFLHQKIGFSVRFIVKVEEDAYHVFPFWFITFYIRVGLCIYQYCYSSITHRYSMVIDEFGWWVDEVGLRKKLPRYPFCPWRTWLLEWWQYFFKCLSGIFIQLYLSDKGVYAKHLIKQRMKNNKTSPNQLTMYGSERG
jgi:hypothetical protein